MNRYMRLAIVLLSFGLFGSANEAHAITTAQALVTCNAYDGQDGLQCAACWGDPQVIAANYLTACRGSGSTAYGATAFCANHGGISTQPRVIKDEDSYSADYNCSATGASAAPGVCGYASGQTYASAPQTATALCSAGTPSAVSGSGPWTWTCAGVNGGASSGQCSSSLCGPPSVTLAANPSTINAGDSSNLSWNVSNATACTISGGGLNQSVSPANGGMSVSPTVSTTYTLSCSGPGGNNSAQAPVTVNSVGYPGFDWAADGDVAWSFPNYCNDIIGESIPYANWDDGAIPNREWAECDFPNWPKNSGVDAAGWTGINFPAPAGYNYFGFHNIWGSGVSTNVGTTPVLNGYVLQDIAGTPLFPYAYIRDLDHAKGVDVYPNYPGAPQNPDYSSGYDLFWSQTGGNYQPNDAAIAFSHDGSNSELADLQTAMNAAIGVGTMTDYGVLVYLACDHSGSDTFATCFNTHASVPGAKGDTVSKSYPNGDAWTFHIHGPDANGGCFYDADDPSNPGGNGWSQFTSGGWHGWKLTNNPNFVHSIGHCHVWVTFHRAANSTAVSYQGNNGGLSNAAFCAEYPHATLSSNERYSCYVVGPRTPIPPNTSTTLGPQSCPEACDVLGPVGGPNL